MMPGCQVPSRSRVPRRKGRLRGLMKNQRGNSGGEGSATDLDWPPEGRISDVHVSAGCVDAAKGTLPTHPKARGSVRGICAQPSVLHGAHHEC